MFWGLEEQFVLGPLQILMQKNGRSTGGQLGRVIRGHGYMRSFTFRYAGRGVG